MWRAQAKMSRQKMLRHLIQINKAYPTKNNKLINKKVNTLKLEGDIRYIQLLGKGWKEERKFADWNPPTNISNNLKKTLKHISLKIK